MLGRSSSKNQVRAENVKVWVQERSPYALCSLIAGIIAVVDSVTLVIGLVMGVVAIAVGIAGLRDIRRSENLCGRKVCYVGIALGVLALLLSFVVWVAMQTFSGAK